MTGNASDALGDATRGAGTLWAGMLAPPLLMLANLQATYMLAPWECRSGATWVGHTVTAVLLALDLLAGLGAAQQLSRLQHDDSVRSRAGFMAMLGVSESILFGAVIIAQWIPRAYLSACQ